MEKKLPSRIRRKRNIKIKKSTVGLFVAFFAFVFSMFYVFAGENPKVIVSKIESASVGQKVKLEINLENNKEYGFIGFTVNFDPSKLEFVRNGSSIHDASGEDDEDPYFDFVTLDQSQISEGKLLLSYALTDPAVTAHSDALLAELNFRPKEGASGQIDVTIDNLKMSRIGDNEQEVIIPVDKEDGYIKVQVPVDPESVRLNKTEFEIQKGTMDTVSVVYGPTNTTDDKTATFESSDPSIASVNNNGEITANAVGTATITVNAFGKTMSATVTVVSHITGVTINGSKHELSKGEELNLSAVITPEDTGDDKTLTWASSDTSVAAVNSSGRVTALSGGDTIITATSVNDVVGTYNISVVVPMESFEADIENLTLEKGSTRKVNTTITPEDTTENTEITWVSSANGVATVSSDGTISAIAAGDATITGTLENNRSVTINVTVVVPLESIELDADSIELVPTQKRTLNVSINPEDTTDDTTVTWASGNAEVATVSNGEVTAVAPGTTTITATVGTKSDTVTVKVLKPIENFVISESEVTLNRNASKQLTVTITPEDAEEDKTVTWTSSDPASVSVASDGTITGLKGTQSPVTITGELANGKTVTCAVTVVVPIESIEINKTSTTINKTETDTLSITINPEDTSEDTTVTWTSGDDTIATVSSSGVVTGIKAGTTTITATVGSFSKVCSVTVVVPLQSITIDQDDFTLNRGQNKTLSITINPEDTTDESTVVWASSDESVATVDSNGKVIAVGAGEATITVTKGTKSDTVDVEVIVPIEEFTATKTSTTILRTASETIETTISPADTTEDTTITWTSSNTSVATVDENGKVTGVGAGSAVITGTLPNNMKVTINVTVEIIEVTAIELNKESLEINRKSSEQLTVTYSPENATEVTDYVWSSSDESVATVDENGNVTGVGEGTATITVRMGQVQDTATVTVNIVEVEGVSLQESEPTTEVGQTYQLKVTFDPNDATETDDLVYTYESSDPEIATVDENGKVTTKKPGKVKITIKASNGTDEFEDTVEIEVKAPTSPQTGVTPIWVYGGIVAILLIVAVVIYKKKELF